MAVCAHWKTPRLKRRRSSATDERGPQQISQKTEVGPGSLLNAVLKKPGAQISTNLKFTGWKGLRSTHSLFSGSVCICLNLWLARWLLLSDAVDRSHSPDQWFAVDWENSTIGKHALKCFHCAQVV